MSNHVSLALSLRVRAAGALEQACPGACGQLVGGLAVPHLRSSCQAALCSTVRGTAQPSQLDALQTTTITGLLSSVATSAVSQLAGTDAAEQAADTLCACAAVASTAVTAVEQLGKRSELATLTQIVVGACASRPHGLQVAESAVDLLSAINAHSIESRCHALGHGLFGACVQHLLLVAMYPPDFSDWNAADVDATHFLQFRSQEFADVILQAYELNGIGCDVPRPRMLFATARAGVLLACRAPETKGITARRGRLNVQRCRFMDDILKQAGSASQPSWQQLEVSAYALFCLTSQIAAELRQPSNGRTDSMPQVRVQHNNQNERLSTTAASAPSSPKIASARLGS